MTDIWMTSDLHLGHARIIDYCLRPYSSIEAMNEALIENNNKVVKPEDTVIDVGDFSMSEKVVEPIMKRLNGKRILVMGNHDKCFPSHKKSAYWIAKYLEWGFVQVIEKYDLMIGNESVHVQHMPYVADERHAERYAEYRPTDDGRWLLHGHVHQSWAQKDKQINVGVDVRDYKPMHIDEVVAIIQKGI